MLVKKIGKHRVGFGAHWASLPGAKTPKKEISQIARDSGTSHHVTLERPGRRPMVAVVSCAGHSTVLCAATLYLRTIKSLNTAAIISKLNDTDYSLICYIESHPMVGYDIVGPIETVTKRLSDFIAMQGEVEFYASEAETVFNGVGIYDVFPCGLSEEKISGLIDLREHKYKRSVINIRAIGIACSVAGLIGLSIYGYSLYEEEARKKAPPAAAFNAQQAYDKNIQQALSSVDLPARQYLSTILSEMENIPLFIGGWPLTKIECTNLSCVTTWIMEPNSPATFSSFSESMPKDWIAAYEDDFKTIKATVHVQGDESKLKRVLARNAIEDAAAFFINQGTASQKFSGIGAKYTLAAPTPFAMPPAPPDRPPISENEITGLVKEGKWSIDGPIFISSMLGDFPESILSNTLTITVSKQGMALKIDGNYYVKK